MNLTNKQYKEARQKTLDDEWLKKYPNGLYYIITHKLGANGHIDYGHMNGRPTSRSGRYTFHNSNREGCRGYYVGAGYFTVIRHQTYVTKEAFDENLKETLLQTL